MFVVVGELVLNAVGHAQLLAQALPAWMLSREALLGYLLLGLISLRFSQDENPRKQLTASIRAAVGAPTHGGGIWEKTIQLTNIGELEAQALRIDPITTGGFPWQLECAGAGSVVAGTPVRVRCTVSRRENLNCDDCTRPTASLIGFTVEAARHADHSTKDALSMPVVVRSRDEFGRKEVAEHRLNVSINGSTQEMRIEFVEQRRE